MTETINKKRFALDSLLNIIASGIATAALQLLMYPYFARNMSADEYGTLLLLMGFANMFSLMFGNALNNVRLIVDIDYKKQGLKGDFNPLFLISIGFTALCIVLATFLSVQSVDAVTVAGISAVTLLGLVRAYYCVDYYLHLNFKRILLQNIFFGAGGILGLLLVSKTGLSWTVPFICAEGAACIYIFFTCDLLKEPLRFTKRIKDTSKRYVLLIFTSLMSSMITYLDRLLLYPIMGAADVAIYTTAAFFGKILNIVTSPLSAVIFGYFAKRESMSRKSFVKQTVIVLAACAAFYLLSITGLATWITGLLYPTLISAAQPYIWIANLAAIILVATNMIQPAVLKYCDTKWQPLIQGVHIALYFGLGISFANAGGLMGFCYAALIANSVKMIILFFVGVRTLKKKEA